MLELEQLLINRINDIKTLEAIQSKEATSEERSKEIRSLYLKQKNAEAYRLKRETFLIFSLNSSKLDSIEKLKEMHRSVKNIISSYDPKLVLEIDDRNEEITLRTIKLLQQFFSKHHFKQKIPQLQIYYKRNRLILTNQVFLSWLSEWTKKKYMRILHGEVQINLYELRGKTSEIYLKESPSSKCLARQNPILCSRQIKQTDQQLSCPRTFKTELQLEAKDELKEKSLNIFSRQILHRYLTEELSSYYSVIDCKSQFDIGYPKSIQKKYKKGILGARNIKEGVIALLQTAGNKLVNNARKQYEQKYAIYKKKVKEERERKKERRKTDITGKKSIDSDRYNIKQAYPEEYQLSALKKSNLLNEPVVLSREQGFDKSKPKKVYPNSQNSQEITRFSTINNTPQQKHLKLPQVPLKYKPYHKNQRTLSPLKNSYQIPLMSPQVIQPQEIPANLLNKPFLSQRKPLKGLIIKNYLTQKERKKRIYTEDSQTAMNNKKERKQKMQILINDSYSLLNESSVLRLNANKYEDSRKDTLELGALRKKTKAILTNLKIIQAYQ